MNSFDKSGTYDAATLGSGTSSASANSNNSDAIIVDDARLLFSGDYQRSGSDLILFGDGHRHVIFDYFRGEKRASLASPDGARLSGHTVEALTGQVHYAQADGNVSPAQVIGHVTKLAGSATVTRNGVSIVLNMGDNVNKGDVVQAGANSTLGLTFIDGTVFGLSSNARMVLNELVYDPNGTSNNSLLTLVQGTISFVAGETAKHGSMKVDTPVATMGIRGTAVLVEIGFEVPGQGDAPSVKFQVLMEPNGVTGSYVLYSKTDPAQVIGTVNQAGQLTSVTGAGDVSQSQAPALSPFALAIIEQTFEAVFPNYTPNPNPQSTHPGGLGSAPADPVPGASNPDKLPLSLPFDTPITIPIPINLPSNTPLNIGPSAIPVTVTVTATKTIDVTPVVDARNFAIPNQVTVHDGDPADIIIPYVAGSARIVSVTAPNAPAGVDLTSFVSVDPQTGAVSYDLARFAFLAKGQQAIITIAFDSKAGTDVFHSTLTATINGVNDPPTVVAANFSVERGGTVLLSVSNIVVSDPDSSNFSFQIANVTHGSFQISTDGINWSTTSSFTTADLAAGHVRFVHDGSSSAAAFTITADDRASANHLSSSVTGNVSLTSDHLPVVTVSGSGFTELPGTNNTTVDHASGVINFTDQDVADRPTVSASFTSAVLFNAQHVPVSLNGAQVGALTIPLQLSAAGNFNNGSVTWTYSIPDNGIDFLSAGETLTLLYTATVDDGHGSIVSAPLTILITGANDVPTLLLQGNVSGIVADDGRGVGTLNANGSITFQDPDLHDTHIATFSLASTSGGAPPIGTFALLAHDSGTGGGSVGWNFSLPDNDPFLRALAAGQTVTQVYTVYIADGNNASVTQDVTVTIIGSNDAPDVTATSGTASTVHDASQAQKSASGTITFSDPDLTDRPAVATSFSSFTYVDANHQDVTANLSADKLAEIHSLESALSLAASADNTNQGSATWNFNVSESVLGFLAVGETLTLNYTATVDDGHGGVTSTPFSVTIGGTQVNENNVPPVVIADSGSISEASDTTGSTSPDTILGAITFTDANADDRPTVSVNLASAKYFDAQHNELTSSLTGTEIAALQAVSSGLTFAADPTNANNGSATWTYSAADNKFDFLGAGETISLNYVATVDNGHGGITSAPFSVTVTGTNDRPTLSGSSVTTATINLATLSAGHVSDGAAAILAAHPSGLIGGLNGGSLTDYGQVALSANDDNSSSAINIDSVFGSTGLNFFGTSYHHLFINNNGNITFGSPSSTFTPSVISGGINNPIIAAFWADVDTRAANGGHVYYQMDATDGIMTITWDHVGYYNSHADKTDTFQIVLVSEGGGNFDISYRYAEIQWTAGDASGGTNGRSGTPARAGYSAGDNAHYFELPQSGNETSLLALPTTAGNTGINGVDAFQVRNGNVAPSSVMASGEIDFSDPDLTDVHTAQSIYSGTGPALGSLTLVKVTDTTGSGTDGKFNWTYNADPAGVQTALAGGSKIESFNVTISDGHGGTLVQTVSVDLTSSTVQTSTVTEHLVSDTGSSSTDGVTSNPALAGTGAADTPVQFTVDGHPVSLTTPVVTDGNGAWTFTPTLSDGPHTIVASQGQGGSTSSSTPLMFTVETHAPVVTITNSNLTTLEATQTITGTVDNASTVTLYDNNVAIGTATPSDGAWSATVTLNGIGAHNIVAKDTDTAGNVASSSAVTYTLQSGSQTSDNSPSNYFTFDGSNYVAELAISTATDNVTFEGWVRWDGSGSTSVNQVIFYNGNSSTTGYGLFGHVNDGSLQLLGLTGGHDIITFGASLTANEWHYVTLERSSGTAHLYVDGTEASGAAAVTANPISLTDQTAIGGNPNNTSEGFHGSISEPQLWNSVRSTAQINLDSVASTTTELYQSWPLQSTNVDATQSGVELFNLNGRTVYSGVLHIVDYTELDLKALVGSASLTISGELINDGSIVLFPETTLEVGNVTNAGLITVDATSQGSTLQINGVGYLSGHGVVTLSGASDSITGESGTSDTLINIDNTINGVGNVGGGHLEIVNQSEGIIDANAASKLTIDTGTDQNLTNYGKLSSTSSGGLEIAHSVVNYGTLESDAGLLKIDGDVSGHGFAVIGGGTMEFTGHSDASVKFAHSESNHAGSTLILDDPTNFVGSISGIAEGDAIHQGALTPSQVVEQPATNSIEFDFQDAPNLIVANYTGSSTSTLQAQNGQTDILIGGPGRDNFAFSSDLGSDTITNFHQGEDKIVLNFYPGHSNGQDTSFENWLADQSHFVHQGADTLVVFDANHSILLKNFYAQLTASDFSTTVNA